MTDKKIEEIIKAMQIDYRNLRDQFYGLKMQFEKWSKEGITTRVVMCENCMGAGRVYPTLLTVDDPIPVDCKYCDTKGFFLRN